VLQAALTRFLLIRVSVRAVDFNQNVCVSDSQVWLPHVMATRLLARLAEKPFLTTANIDSGVYESLEDCKVWI
jgi:hypothetical protein